MNYRTLLDKALKEFDSFSLVWRDAFEFDDESRKIEKELTSFMLSEERTNEWSGTKIFGSLATVRHYKVCKETMVILGQVNSFAEWIAPSKPEDLAFYKGGEVVYTSIAHENEGW